MQLAIPSLRVIVAILAVPILAFALSKRINVIVAFQRAEVGRGTRFAKARVVLAGAAVALLVVIGVAAAAGASVRAVYALLFIEAGCVFVYLVLTGAAGSSRGPR